MSRREELERASLVIGGEAPPDEASSPALAELNALLAAAAELPMDLPDDHLTRLVDRALASASAQRPRPWLWLAAAAAVLVTGVALALAFQDGGVALERPTGFVTVNGRRQTQDLRVELGSVVETGERSMVELSRDGARVILAPNGRAVAGQTFELQAGVARFISDEPKQLRVAATDVEGRGSFVAIA